MLPIASFVQAQKKTQTVDASFGIKGGLVLANLLPAEGSKYRASYQTVIVGQFRIKKTHYIKAELMFSNEGESYTNYDVAHYNLLVPFLYKTDLTDWLALEFGPQLTMNISQYWYLDNTVWVCADVGLCFYVTDSNYFNFRYSKGLGAVYTEPNYSSSVFSLTLVNVF